MITVEKLLGNIFDKPGMSRAHLLTYSKDLLKNSGKLLTDFIIANLTYRYQQLFLAGGIERG